MTRESPWRRIRRLFYFQKFERKTSLGIILASVGFEAIGLLRYESISKTCERTRFTLFAGCIYQLLDRAAVLLYNYGLNPAPCFFNSHITMGTDYISTLPLFSRVGY